MKRASLFVCVIVLLASILACTLPSLFGPSLYVTLAPEPGAAWDDASLKLARDVLLSRLNSMGYTGTVSASSDGKLHIILPASANLEAISPLLTEAGGITFVDSVAPAEKGTTVSADLKIILTGKDIDSLTVTQDSFGGYQIAITFTSEGAQKMAEYSSANVGHYLIIARDGVVISSPVINSAITEGKAIIQGNFTQESATLLAAQLKSGALPFPLVILDSSITK